MTAIAWTVITSSVFPLQVIATVFMMVASCDCHCFHSSSAHDDSSSSPLLMTVMFFFKMMSLKRLTALTIAIAIAITVVHFR